MSQWICVDPNGDELGNIEAPSQFEATDKAFRQFSTVKWDHLHQIHPYIANHCLRCEQLKPTSTNDPRDLWKVWVAKHQHADNGGFKSTWMAGFAIGLEIGKAAALKQKEINHGRDAKDREETRTENIPPGACL